jgi:hypothetical protein
MISRACSNPFKMCCTSLKLQGLSPMTSTYNVEKNNFNLFIAYKKTNTSSVVIHHGKMFMSWKIIILLLWVSIFFFTPSILMAFLPTFATLYLFLLPNSLCELHTYHKFLHFILIFLLSFCFLFPSIPLVLKGTYVQC